MLIDKKSGISSENSSIIKVQLESLVNSKRGLR